MMDRHHEWPVAVAAGQKILFFSVLLAERDSLEWDLAFSD